MHIVLHDLLIFSLFMSTVVFGVGTISFFLVKKLLYENEVIVIANEGEDVSRFEDLGANVFFVSSVDPKSLTSLNIGSADVCIALYEQDELNMITCQLMWDIFGTKVRVAKIKNEFYLQDRGFLKGKKDGLMTLVGNVFSMEEEVSNALISNLQFVKGMDFKYLMNDAFVLTGINVTKKVENLVNVLKSYGCSVLGILRESVFIPEDRLEEVEVDDTIYIIVKKTEMYDIIGNVFDIYLKMGNRSVIVIGGGSMGLAIAKSLQRHNLFKTIKIVEKDLSRAKLLFENVEDIEIVHGDALDQGVIVDASIQEADLLIGATDNDSVNVISSYMGKKLGCEYMVGVLREDSYAGILKSFGADLVINSFDVFASKIVNFIRQDKEVKTYFFADGRYVALETKVKKTSTFNGMKVAALESKYDIIVAVVKGKSGHMHPPIKSYKIVADDTIIISMPYARISQIKKLLDS